jgi:hypothetical protein
MPYSHPENNDWVRDVLTRLNPKTITDVGPGAGKYGSLVKSILPEAHLTCVEIWAPYVERFGLGEIYNSVIISDARIYSGWDCDLVILGDVLEHMSEAEALSVWRKISQMAKYAIIAIPIVHYPQGPSEGNPFEAHVDDHWTHERVMAAFPQICEQQVFEITGSYLADFGQK